ncbi:MAG: thermonuclease family protein [Alphaproteobacteria bacterium]
MMNNMGLSFKSEKRSAGFVAVFRYMAYLMFTPLFTIQVAFATPANKRLQGPVFAIVERVIDGDTIAVRARIWLHQELRVNVRIARIDTPELAARCARERELAGRARDFVQKIIFADGLSEPSVWLSDIGQDKYGGRVLARVTGSSGGDIAQALIQAGLANVYDGKKRADWCRNFKL